MKQQYEQMKKNLIGVILSLGLTQAVSAQTLAWAKGIDAASTNTGYDIVTDASGNIYVSGQFSGTTDFDPGVGTSNLTSVGIFDAFAAKYDASGNLVWAKQMGGAIAEGAISRGIELDASGNVYIIGEFTGTADFDPNAGTANLTSFNNDIFICKLSTTGTYMWAKNIGGTNPAYGIALEVDGSGNVYTTGQFQSTADFDPGVGVYNMSAVNGDAFLSKLDTDGDFVWAIQFGGTGSDGGNSLFIDDADDIYITGSFVNTIDFDPGVGINNLTSAGQSDVFICKLDGDANHIWSTSFGGTLDDIGNSITADAFDNIYVTGNYEGTTDFDPGVAVENATAVGTYDVFVSKFNSDGSFEWSKQFGGSTFDFGMSVATDPSGKVYVGGIYQTTVDFDPGAGTINNTSAGTRDMFIQKLDSSGNFINVKLFGSTSDDNLKAIHVDASNNIYSTGEFNGTVDFDPNTGTVNLVSTGQQDAFILKLAQSNAGINEIVQMNISIYPNPATSQITLQTTEIIKQISIFNLSGQIVQTENKNIFSVENLPAGVYILQVQTESGISNVRFVKE
jgi:hypothetical protein